MFRGPGSSVRIVTTGWTFRGSNLGGGETFLTYSYRPWGPPSLLYDEYRVFPVGKERPGRDADPSPPSSVVVKKEYSYTSTPPMDRTACTEPQCLYSTAIPLLPLWAVRPVQACTLPTLPMSATQPDQCMPFEVRMPSCGTPLLAASCQSFRTSAWSDSAPTGRIFVKFYFWGGERRGVSY